MKNIKVYTDIKRYGHKSTLDVLKVGDYITITEKIDGANASFTLDMDNILGVSSYSRNNILTPEKDLRGFYGWVEKNVVSIKDKLNPNFRYFGEWLVSHKIKYPDTALNKFYLFSIWDEVSGTYVHDDVVQSEAKRLGLTTVPYLYKGAFISIEHLMSFVGKSMIIPEGEGGEGIVIKNIDYKDKGGNQVFVKIVREGFSEIKTKKPHSPMPLTKEDEVVVMLLTPARVEKMLHKLVDEGVLTEDFDIEDMGTILKNINVRLIEDIYKEEMDMLEGLDKKIISKAVAKKTPNIVKGIILGR